MPKTNRLCVFVTLEDTTGHVIDDGLCRPLLEQQGLRLESWPWTVEHPWHTADLIVFRSCYDYWLRPEQFTAFITSLEQLNIPLVNHPKLIRWNLNKRYLEQLKTLGIPVIDTVIIHPSSSLAQIALFLERHKATEEFVVKHLVGAGGFEMQKLSRQQLEEFSPSKEMMLQPFLKEITWGEWSAIFFGGEPSHAVVKRAQAGEYRVQDSHGGTTASIRWQDKPKLLEASQLVALAMKALGLPQACYARYDFIETGPKQELLLMEVELIEPTLFLSHESNAAQRFVSAFLSYAREYTP